LQRRELATPAKIIRRVQELGGSGTGPTEELGASPHRSSTTEPHDVVVGGQHLGSRAVLHVIARHPGEHSERLVPARAGRSVAGGGSGEGRVRGGTGEDCQRSVCDTHRPAAAAKAGVDDVKQLLPALH